MHVMLPKDKGMQNSMDKMGRALENLFIKRRLHTLSTSTFTSTGMKMDQANHQSRCKDQQALRGWYLRYAVENHRPYKPSLSVAGKS